MTQSEDHSIVYRHSGCIYLVVYVDDIVLTNNYHYGIALVKQHFCHHFQIKYLGKLRYLGVEVAKSNNGIFISQRKYAFDISEDTGLMNSKSVDTPTDPNTKILPNRGSHS